MVTRFFDVFSGKDIDDPDVGRAVNVERVTQSTELQPHVAVASVSAGLVAIYYVISQGGADWVWLTLLPIIAIAISALGSWLKYRDRPIPHHVHPRSVLRASIMLCLFGALWGEYSAR